MKNKRCWLVKRYRGKEDNGLVIPLFMSSTNINNTNIFYFFTLLLLFFWLPKLRRVWGKSESQTQVL